MPHDAAQERERQRRIRQSSHDERTPQPIPNESRMGAGGDQISLAIISSLAQDDPDVLFVKYLDENGDPAAEAESVMIWPNMADTDWETFIGTDIVVPVVKYLDVPYVMQLPRWEMTLPPPGIVIGGCPF